MRRDRRGMTLIELSVALVIVGLMAAAGTAAFASIIDHRAVILRASTATERASTLRETVHAWLVSGTVSITTGGIPRNGGRGATSTLRTVTPGSSTAAVQSVTAAVASGDELDVTTTAPNPAGSPSARMRLFVDGDASTPETGLTLEYQASTQSPLLRIQLEPTIATIVIEYLDSRTKRWFPASQASTITPRAVRITFQGADGSLPSPACSPFR